MPVTQPTENTQSAVKVESTQPHLANGDTEKILCLHCRRTATNGIKCKGICVADNDY